MRFSAAALVVAVLSTILSGCLADPLPWPTVRDFLLAWQSERYRDAAAKTTGSPEEVATALRQAREQLDARDLQLGIENVTTRENSAKAVFQARVRLEGIGREWTYQSRMQLRRTDGGWRIAWSPQVIHPRLDEGEQFAIVTDLPSRAPLLDAEGERLVRETPVVTVGVQPGALTDRKRTVSVLARTTQAKPDQIRSLINSADPKSFVPIATLRQSAYAAIKGKVEGLPGVRLQSDTVQLPPEPSFAQAVLGGVGAITERTLSQAGSRRQAGPGIRLSGLHLAYRQRLSGTPGSEVITVNSEGRQSGVLAEFPGRESRPVHTTIDADAQRAAERALRDLDSPAAFVAVQASTGNVLAVANRPVRSTHNRAFLGKYRPGSAFKVVATEALLSSGVQPSSPVPCPEQRIVSGETFRNDQVRFPGGEAPSFRADFANSCDTAFVGLSRKLSDGALQEAASTFGIGGQWDLPLPVFTGTVPKSADEAGKAAATVGRGSVRVSPLGMALTAAAVGSGTWRPPTLVTEPSRQSGSEPRSLPIGHADELRGLMREAVESGTARDADLPGPQVHGTTGTATRSGGAPDSWFLGYRGDLAFALVVEGDGGDRGGDGGNGQPPGSGSSGGSGEEAASAAADFLTALDYEAVFDEPPRTRTSTKAKGSGG